MAKNKKKTSIKQKAVNGVKKRALNFMQGLVDKVGNELFTQLMTLREKMNISIDQLLDDNKDVNQFWNLVDAYYRDYLKGVDE